MADKLFPPDPQNPENPLPQDPAAPPSAPPDGPSIVQGRGAAFLYPVNIEDEMRRIFSRLLHVGHHRPGPARHP